MLICCQVIIRLGLYTGTTARQLSKCERVSRFCAPIVRDALPLRGTLWIQHFLRPMSVSSPAAQTFKGCECSQNAPTSPLRAPKARRAAIAKEWDGDSNQ